MMIKFSAFRHYEEAFIKSNDAMMALLVASQLTSDFLEQHPDRKTLLPDLFERVSEIKRLNRSADDATEILVKSESYLANMAIVYVLSVHQSFMDEVVEFLKKYNYEIVGHNSRGEIAKIDAENVYQAIEDCFDAKFNADLLEQFYFTRRVRNRITHYGGKPGKLGQDSNAMTEKNRVVWRKRMGRSLKDLLNCERIELTSGELIGILALSRRVAIEVQEFLAVNVDRNIWASVAVKDYAEKYPTRFRNIERRFKHIQGYANNFYGGLSLTKEELLEALDLHQFSIEEVPI